MGKIEGRKMKWVTVILTVLILLFLSSSCAPSNNHPTSTSNREQQLPNPTATAKQPVKKPTTVLGCVTVSSLRIRSGPGTQYEIVGGLVVGDCIRLDARNSANTWGRLNGRNYWVSLDYIDSISTSKLPIILPQQVIPQTTKTQGAQATSRPAAQTPTSGTTGSLIVDSSKANLYIGQMVTVRINDAICEWNPGVEATFCNDYFYPNHNFTYLTWNVDVSYMDGRCLLVTGKVENYKGKPQIIAGAGTAVYFC